MFLAIIAIILTLILVVGIHEGGHALAGRIFAVKIKKISIGFGKPLLTWQSRSGCEWVWAFFPWVDMSSLRIPELLLWNLHNILNVSIKNLFGSES